MNVNDWYLFHGVGNVIIFHRVIGPRLLGLTPDEEAIKAAMPKAHAVFDELARLLGDQPYFTGDTLSLADLLRRAGGRVLHHGSGMVRARRAARQSGGMDRAHAGAAEHEGDDLGARLELAKAA